MAEKPLRVAIELLDPRLTGWGFPRWGSQAAAGLDLHACIGAPLVLGPQAPAVLIPAGLVIKIRDPDWCGLIHARSGLGHREGLVLGNGTGVIDADYEGPILVSAWNRNPAGNSAITVIPGDRIAQIVFTRVVRPALDVTEAFGTSETTARDGRRGGRGFGSTGRS